jgi:hypothetical protein
MAFRFPHLLITASFGSLSAHLSLRADAAEVKIGKFVVAVPSPQTKPEAVRREGKARPVNETA